MGRDEPTPFLASRAWQAIRTTRSVQNRILREHPWVALELFDAFKRSREIAYERARRYASAYLYFPGKDREEQVS
jgi:hypothetical protein